MLNRFTRRRLADDRRQSSQRLRRRRLQLEQLEIRLPLAAPSDLAVIEGRVFADANGDGYTAGEELPDVAVNLYRDNGNGQFDPATDLLVASGLSDQDGTYRFESLTAGAYFVEQPAQSAGGQPLPASVSPLINISADDAAGQLLTVIDSFDAAPQLVFDDTADGVPVASSVQGPTSEILGGERDILVNKTSVNGRVQISVNDPLLPGYLSFDSIQTGQGQRVVSWDGPDGDALRIDDTGLGEVDLTSAAAATGLRLEMGADSAAGFATIRIYSDDGNAETATRFSTAVVPIPETGGEASALEFVPFTAFVATSGGGADLARVGAIELEITGAANVNGAANLVGATGPTVNRFDFNVFRAADLSLTLDVDDPTPPQGNQVTFTLAVANDGPDPATGVAVRGLLPAGLQFVAATPSQGNYDAASGIWTLDSLADQATATLQLVASVQGLGPLSFTTEIVAADQVDPDSTPDNNDPTEDDQASVVITTQTADLALAVAVDQPAPQVGDVVRLTVTVDNAGPDAATGVTVAASLPAGLAFIASSPSQGTYAADSGRWEIGEIAAGGSITLELEARVESAGSLTMTAQVAQSDAFDPDSTPGNDDPAEDDQASVTITPQAADLALALTVDQPAPQVGDVVRLTVTVDNAGPNDATGVAVAALLPAGLTFIASAPSQGTYAADSGRWEIGEIAAGGEVTLELEARVESADSLAMTAQVAQSDAFDPDSTPGNDDPAEDDQASVTITPHAADLALFLTIDQPAPNVGEVVRLTVTVDNAGPNAAGAVVVAAPLPAGLTFIASSPSQGTYAAESGRWEIGEIAAGGAVTLELEARVASAGSLAMTAQVAQSDAFDPDSTPGNDDPAEDDQDSVVVTTQAADLALDLAIDQPAPHVGDEVRLTLTVNNSGPDAATSVVVEALLPEGLTFVSSSPAQGTYTAASGRWEIGTIAAGEDVVLQLVARVDAPGALALTAQVAESATFDPDSTPGNDDPAEDDQASVVISAQAADLALNLAVDQPAPNVGDVVRLTVSVDNSGPNAAAGVVVAALLPAGLTFVSASPSQGTYAAETGRWEIGAVAAGDVLTLELEARVESAESLAVTAQVAESDAFDPDSTPGNDDPAEDDQASVVIAPQRVDLSLTMAVDQPRPLVGQELTFTLTLANDGPDAATAIAVRDALPAGLSFIDAVTSVGEYDAVSGLWTLDNLAAGATATLQLIARYDAPVTLTNIAEVVAVDQFDIDSTPDNGIAEEDDQDAVTIEPATADLSLSKTVDNAAPYLGQSVTFTIVVTNAGPDTATGVSVLDTLADGLAFVSATTTAGTYDAATGIWAIGEIAADAAVTLELTATPTAAATATNVAEVLSADQFDPDSTPGNQAAEEDDQDAVAVTPQLIDLSLSKTINNDRPNVGQSVTYVLALTNDGPSTATGVQVLDTLPATTEFVSFTTTSGSFSATTGIWTPDPIAAGTTATLTIIARVSAPGEATNTAEVIAADQPDLDSTPGNGDVTEDDFASVTFNTPIADLSLVHTVNNVTPDRDERVTFTIVVTNHGPDEATGVEVTHRLPANFSYAKSTASAGTFTPTSGLWKIPTLASGSSATLTVTGRITNLAPLTSTAEITEADQVDPNSTPGNGDPNEDDFGQVVVTPNVIDLAVTGSIDNLAPEIGDVVTLTFTVNNTGPATATGVALAAALPAGVTTLFHGATLGVFDPVKDLWTVGTLAPGEFATLSLQLRVDTAGIKLATLQVVAADQFDIDSTPANNAADEDDQATVPIKAPRLLGLRMFLAR